MNLRIASLILIAVVFGACGKAIGAMYTPAPTAEAVSSGVSGLQQHEGGAVTVAAEWIPGSTSLKIGLDTHSVDLDGYDLKQLARVRMDGGPWVAPTAWDAPAGGHHRGGTLAFASLDPTALGAARVVELEIRDAPVTHLLRWTR